MRRCSVALLSLAGFLVMAHALGQEPESDAVTQMARQRFEEGVKLFDRGDYKGAQAAFLQAWTLKQHPAVLLNLAQSELRSGDHVAAARHFATYLRDYPDTPAKERAAAQQGLTEARKHTGQLEIMADDTNVEVLINNESVGRTPLPGPVDIAPGSYQIVGRLAGSEPFESSGSVQAGQSKSVEITFHQLAPPPPPPGSSPSPIRKLRSSALPHLGPDRPHCLDYPRRRRPRHRNRNHLCRPSQIQSQRCQLHRVPNLGRSPK